MAVMEWIALSALALNFITAIVLLTWGVGKVKDQVKDHLKDDIDELVLAIAESELKLERKTGEVGAALREKITQVEFFVRDNYVREKDFDSMIKMFEGRFDRLQDSMDRLGEKIDNNSHLT
jgi:hypothetical protein